MTSTSLLKTIQRKLPKGSHLLAVSKGQPSSKIRKFSMQGQYQFGESRLQEALPKLKDLEDIKEIRWHFIGHIQANKVRLVVKKFDFIHSLDSFKLAERVSRIAGEEGRNPSIMVQVKFRLDPNKSGFSKNELLDVWTDLISLPNIQIVGLMTIAPIGLDLDQRKTLFKECREFADKLSLKDCSMGMSRDWEEALEAGSTWIRVGSALFREGH